MISPAILSEMVTDQCMRLTGALLGQYDFIDLSHPLHEYWCPFESFKIRFDELFAKDLIELSVLARVCLDVDEEFGSDAIVGSLTEDNERCELSFRQACNKVIHAETLDIDFAWCDRHPLDNGRNGYAESSVKTFKDPIVKTTGQYRKRIGRLRFVS